jgi:hypothetical protein
VRRGLVRAVRLDQPQLVVDAARDLGEQVGGVDVAELVALVDRVAHRLANACQRLRHRGDMRRGVGDPQPVRFEERPLGRRLNRSLGGAAEGARPFGDLVRVLLDDVGDLVEQLVDRNEGRTADVPMRLLGLRVQVNGGGEVTI